MEQTNMRQRGSSRQQLTTSHRQLNSSRRRWSFVRSDVEVEQQERKLALVKKNDTRRNNDERFF